MKNKIKLEGFDVLYTYETNLPHNIFIDDCQSYKTHNRNLCFLIFHNDIFYPFSIANGEIICENETPFNEEIYIKLGKCLFNELIMCANEELFIIDMLHCIQKFSEKNMELLKEYYIKLTPNQTGIQIPIYIDSTASFDKSGHNGSYRLKFQGSSDMKNTDEFIPMLLPSLEIPKEFESRIKFSNKVVDDVREFAATNMDLLMKLSHKEIGIDEFMTLYKGINGVVVNDEKPWSICGNERNGFVKVQQKDQKFNFFNTIENRIVFSVWFEELGDLFFFDKIPFTFGCVDSVWKKVTVDGKITDV